MFLELKIKFLIVFWVTFAVAGMSVFKNAYAQEETNAFSRILITEIVRLNDNQSIKITEKDQNGSLGPFPKIGFYQAKFKFVIKNEQGELVDNKAFNWKTNFPVYINLGEGDQSGVVTLTGKPLDDTIIYIEAIPKEQRYSGQPLSYMFKLEKWFEPNLPVIITQFSEVEVMSDGKIYPIGLLDTQDAIHPFPKTGFYGAKFKLNIRDNNNKIINSEYEWSSTHPNLASVSNDVTANQPNQVNLFPVDDTENGIVTLIERPSKPTIITISAVPKSGITQTRPKLTYHFELKKWFSPTLSEIITEIRQITINPEDKMAMTLALNRSDSTAFNFPMTGFTNAKFRLDILNNAKELLNNQYHWTVSHPELVAVGNLDIWQNGNEQSETMSDLDKLPSGTVLLLQKPIKPTEITITATPMSGESPLTPKLTYHFTLQKWFDAKLPDFRTTFNNITIKDKTIEIENTLNSNVKPVSFPKIGFKNAKFALNILSDDAKNLNHNYIWISNRPDLVRVRSSDLPEKQEGNNLSTIGNVVQSLLYQFEQTDTEDKPGTVTLVAKPEEKTKIQIFALPINKTVPSNRLSYEFELEKWFEVQTNDLITEFKRIRLMKPTSNMDDESLETLKSAPLFTQLDDIYDIVRSDNDEYENTFPKTGFKGASFRLDIENGNGELVNHEYDWESSHPELVSVISGMTKSDSDVSTEQNGTITLLTKPQHATIVSITANPKQDINTEGRRKLVYQFKLSKWFDATLDKQIVGFSHVTRLSDNEIIPIKMSSNNGLNENFPKTGFRGAKFRLDIIGKSGELNNQNFEWSSSDPDLAEVVNNLDASDLPGTVTLLEKPNERKSITITATSKDKLVPLMFTYQFMTEKWFDPILPEQITAFNSISSFGHYQEIPINSLDTQHYTQNFPKTGFDGAKFRLNIKNSAGTLINEKYDFEVIGSDKVTVTNSADPIKSGVVELLSRPTQPEDVKIRATLKVTNDSNEESKKPLEYGFRVQKWYAPLLPEIISDFKSITLPGESLTFPINRPVENDFSHVFPRTIFTGAQFKLNIESRNGDNLNDLYTWSSSNNDVITIDEKGVASIKAMPLKEEVLTIKANAKENATNAFILKDLSYEFKPEKFFSPKLQTVRKTFSAIEIGGHPNKKTKLFLPTDVEQQSKFNFPMTGFKHAQFTLEIGENGQENHLYSWKSSHPDLVNVSDADNIAGSDTKKLTDNGQLNRAGTVTLLNKPETLTEIVISATPKSQNTGVKPITYTFSTLKWFNPTLKTPITQFTSISPMLETNPIALPVNSDIHSAFPLTGFKGARFRLNIMDGDNLINHHYEWSSSEDSKSENEKLVHVGNGGINAELDGAGNVTLLEKPSKPTIISVNAQLKPDYIAQYPASKQRLVYQFSLQKWFEVQTKQKEIIQSFDRLVTPIDYAVMKNLPTRLIEGVNQFPSIAFTGAKFRLDILDKETGELLNDDFIWESSSQDTISVGNTPTNAGVIEFEHMPKTSRVITIQARKKIKDEQGASINANISQTAVDAEIVYQYQFKIDKWVELSESQMYGYFEAAPNNRWPAPSRWSESINQLTAEEKAINPDTYCANLGSGFRSISAKEYTRDYEKLLPFTLGRQRSYPRVGSNTLYHEWGNMGKYKQIERGFWLAEPASDSARMAITNQKNYISMINKVDMVKLNAMCVRNIN